MKMKRMRSPTPNRHGVYEVHDVIDRHQARRLAQGWVDIAVEQSAQAPEAEEAVEKSSASVSPVDRILARKSRKPASEALSDGADH